MPISTSRASVARLPRSRVSCGRPPAPRRRGRSGWIDPRITSPGGTAMSMALQGIRVLDLTQFEAGTVVHPVARVARRRGHQGGGARQGRPRPLRARREAGRRQQLLPHAQLEQEGRHPQPEASRGQGHVPRDGEARRRPRGEPGARRAREERLRLRRACRDQSPADLSLDQGLRHLWPVQPVQELRHDRPGDGRGHGAHRLPRLTAAQARTDHRRLRHGRARRVRRHGRAVAAAGHRSRPARRAVHAGRDRQLLPRRHAPGLCRRRLRPPARQRDREHRRRRASTGASRAVRTTTPTSIPSRCAATCGTRSSA